MIKIYTDGACSVNPGIGGWGAIIIFDSGEEKEISGSELETTNNRMEITAVIKSLELKEINIEDAKGFLQKEYNAALNRSGRIWNIVKCMSIHPEAMKSSMELYKCLMFAPSPLNRSEREMLAVVVSARNGCVY